MKIKTHNKENKIQRLNYNLQIQRTSGEEEGEKGEFEEREERD